MMYFSPLWAEWTFWHFITRRLNVSSIYEPLLWLLLAYISPRPQAADSGLKMPRIFFTVCYQCHCYNHSGANDAISHCKRCTFKRYWRACLVCSLWLPLVSWCSDMVWLQLPCSNYFWQPLYIFPWYKCALFKKKKWFYIHQSSHKKYPVQFLVRLWR